MNPVPASPTASEPAEPATDIASTEVDRQRLMSEYSIVHRGRWYCYDGYRYERFEDAVDYAVLVRSRPLRRPTAASSTQVADVEPLTNAADRQLMEAFDISFKGGVYHFENFRYDHLVDAVNYARQRRIYSQAPS